MNVAGDPTYQPPLDRADFEAALRAEESGYWDKHPFHQRMAAGELGPADLRAWVANRWCYQRTLPQKDAAVIANCPYADVRRRWVTRILYHDGPDEGSGGMARWLALGEAVGLSRPEVLDERHVVPGVRHAVDAYLALARIRPWYEGVASSLTELFAPQTMAARTASWRQHYPWVSTGGLAYFESRIDRARHEASDALEIVLSHCRTRERQDAAVGALRFKTSMLWGMLDAIEHSVERA